MPGSCATVFTVRSIPRGNDLFIVLAICPREDGRTAFPGGILCLVFLYDYGILRDVICTSVRDLERTVHPGRWLIVGQRHDLDVDQVFLRCVVIYFCVCVCVCEENPKEKKRFL